MKQTESKVERHIPNAFLLDTHLVNVLFLEHHNVHFPTVNNGTVFIHVRSLIKCRVNTNHVFAWESE